MLELAKSGIKPVSGCLNPVRWDDDDDDADDDDDDAAAGGGGDDDNGWIFNPKRGILNIYIVFCSFLSYSSTRQKSFLIINIDVVNIDYSCYVVNFDYSKDDRSRIGVVYVTGRQTPNHPRFPPHGGFVREKSWNSMAEVSEINGG